MSSTPTPAAVTEQTPSPDIFLRLEKFVYRRTLTATMAAITLTGCSTPASLMPDELAPAYRHSILVSDLERSLTLYRDVLGLELSRVSQTAPDSYSYVFFDIEPGAMRRFAYLDGEGRREILGLGEVPELPPTSERSPRRAAWVQTVPDVESVIEQVQALGLELIPPREFMSREAGRPGLEAGLIDFDGHLILFYGLKRIAAE